MSAVHSPSKGEAEALDPEFVSRTLSSPPFVTIPGVFNVRDIGSLPITSDSARVTRPRYAYRAAEISAIEESGTWLVWLPCPCRSLMRASRQGEVTDIGHHNHIRLAIGRRDEQV